MVVAEAIVLVRQFSAGAQEIEASANHPSILHIVATLVARVK
jgi:hypothetical protein